MPFCDSDGIRIYYEIEGSGPDVIMLHGFTSDLSTSWRITRVIDTLKGENRLIMMDCRGHGKSDKPAEPAMYGAKMLDDVTNLMDHIGIGEANLFGYSMGARHSLHLVLAHPERFKSVILGGFGLPDPSSPPTQGSSSPGWTDTVVKAFLAGSADQVTDPVGRWWRDLADATGNDLKALAAVLTAPQLPDLNTKLEELQAIAIPLMTIVGNDDSLVSDKSRLAMLIRNGCHVQIQGKDHVSVVAGTRFRMMVRAFLNFTNGR